MFYLTGDTHGQFDRIIKFCEIMKTTKDDVLIILGDAGINYYQDSRATFWKKRLEAVPITLLCVHGNHEQRPYAIPSYEEIEWNDGIVYQEPDYPHLLFAKDGEIYQLAGKSVLVLGGAYSVDKFYRLEQGWNWFENEQPSEEIKKYAEQRLDEANWNVDIVLSHTVPVKYEPVEVFLKGLDQSTVDKSTEIWLDDIESRLEYEHWYAGHYHTEKDIDKLTIMFNNYRALETNNEIEGIPIQGRPRYKKDDVVRFQWNKKEVKEGVIQIVNPRDLYEPSYDILVDDIREGEFTKVFYKHVPESIIIGYCANMQDN